MMPEFWQYLITRCDGSPIRFVAEQERHETEKELESDPFLLSYQAKPQTQCPVQSHRTSELLRQLRRARRRLERNHMHDSVVTINGRHWPAHRRDNGVLVDLRLFDPNDHTQKPRLVFRPNALREAGIPEALIEAAARSIPQGLVLFEDMPQFKGCDGQFEESSPTRKPIQSFHKPKTHKPIRIGGAPWQVTATRITLS